MNIKRKHAAIRISQRAWDLVPKKFELAIIHEMLHPLLQPIANEENDIEVEQVVEDLAHILYDLKS